MICVAAILAQGKIIDSLHNHFLYTFVEQAPSIDP